MSLTIYMLRHGETPASYEGRFSGDLDPDLTPEGHQMAEDFARAYRHLPWAGVYCSPMRRTIATAGPICRAIGMEPKIEEGLREIGYGRWEGMTPEEIDRDFHDEYIRWSADPGWHAPTGGQRGVDIARRSTTVLLSMKDACAEGNVLVVSHKATIRIMLCSLLGIDVGRFRDRLAVPAGSVSVVKMAPRGPMLLRLGDQSHFRPALRGRPEGSGRILAPLEAFEA